MTDTELALKATADVLQERFASFSEQIAALKTSHADEISSLRSQLGGLSKFSERSQVEAGLAAVGETLAALQAAVDSLNARMAIIERTETTVLHRGPDGKIESIVKRVG